jgi:hypothetical protein
MVVPSPPPFTNSYSRGGDGFGGGLFNTNGSLMVVNDTLSGNAATGGVGYPDGSSSGGGIASINGSATLLNTILANSTMGSNGFGSLTDAGHNLSSDASCAFTGAGSLNNTDPKLGPLADYGGPTPTMALLSGSPAIDGGTSVGAPATDQRDRARPFGSAVDVGAFESSPPYVIRGSVRGNTLRDDVTLTGAGSATTSKGWFSLEGVAAGYYSVTPTHSNYLFLPASQLVTAGPDQLGVDFRAYRWNALSLDDATNGVLHFVFAGTNGTTWRVLVSTNLGTWTPILTNTVGPASYFDCVLPATAPASFYRAMSP